MYIAQRLSQYLIMEEDYVGPIALYLISTCTCIRLRTSLRIKQFFLTTENKKLNQKNHSTKDIINKTINKKKKLTYGLPIF